MSDDKVIPITEDTRRRRDRDSLHARVDNDFVYHAPRGEKQQRFVDVRDAARAFAHLLIENVPAGRELSSALTRLEEVVFHANAGIARENP